MLVASSSQKGALILCGLALCPLPCRRLLLCPFPVSSGAARRASHGSAPGTRSVGPTSYALPRKRTTEMWLWEAQRSQEVNRTLWQVVKCQPAAHPRSALPHVPPPLRALQEQKKSDYLGRTSQFEILQLCDWSLLAHKGFSQWREEKKWNSRREERM